MVTQTLEFYEGSIIKDVDGTIYEIDVGREQELIREDLPEDDSDSWEYVVYVYLSEFESPTDEEKRITADEFVHMLDNDDVTILQSRQCGYFMSEQQETYWKNYIRMM